MSEPANVTAEEVRESILRNKITDIPVHECGLCGYPCGYRIYGDKVFYDNGCDCVWGGETERTFNDIAHLINMQTTRIGRLELMELVGLNNKKEPVRDTTKEHEIKITIREAKDFLRTTL